MRIEGEKRRGYPERAKPILRSQIEDAVAHTLSNAAAARYLGVDIARYKKYASIYGLYEGHNNKTGIGTTKGFAKTSKSVSLTKIFNNEYPTYSLRRLQGRMIRRRLLEEKCGLCGFDEKRIDGQVPIMLCFKETYRDFTRSNIWFLCYNCAFLTASGTKRGDYAPVASSYYHIKSSLTKNQDGDEDTTSYPKPYTRPEGGADDMEELEGDIPEDLDFDIEQFQNQMLEELKGNEE